MESCVTFAAGLDTPQLISRTYMFDWVACLYSFLATVGTLVSVLAAHYLSKRTFSRRRLVIQFDDIVHQHVPPGLGLLPGPVEELEPAPEDENNVSPSHRQLPGVPDPHQALHGTHTGGRFPNEAVGDLPSGNVRFHRPVRDPTFTSDARFRWGPWRMSARSHCLSSGLLVE